MVVNAYEFGCLVQKGQVLTSGGYPWLVHAEIEVGPGRAIALVTNAGIGAMSEADVVAANAFNSCKERRQ